MLSVQVICHAVNASQKIVGLVNIVRKLILDIILLVKNVMNNVLGDVAIKQQLVVRHVEIMWIREYVLRIVQKGSKYIETKVK